VKVVHVISGLERGGAETALLSLLAASQDKEMSSWVISLKGKGDLGDEIEALGIPVHSLGISSIRSFLTGFLKLIRVLREIRPDLIQGWMYHGNIAAFFGRFLGARRSVLAWNIRHALEDLSNERPSTRIAIAVGRLLSREINGIIYNSRRSAQQHEKYGYLPTRSLVIPNGFDATKFCPDANSRNFVRGKLGLSDKEMAIGMIARFHPVKGHKNFLKAAANLLPQIPSVRFLLVGKQMHARNRELVSLIKAAGVLEKVLLLGERRDLPELLNGMDIVTLSSLSESFPNVLGEAMACGVPCVATDVGDVAWLIGETGRVVQPKDPTALAKGWEDMITAGIEGRADLGRAARSRIEKYFSLSNVAENYADFYRQLTSKMIEKG